MKRNAINFLLPLVLLSAAYMPATAVGQMEKRNTVLYQQRAFENSFPLVGLKSPDMEVRSLDGELVRLSDYIGKQLIVVKGSYT